MNVIIVDDNVRFVESVQGQLGIEITPIITEAKTILEICNAVELSIKSSGETIILLNINLKTSKYNNRSDQNGIDVLKLIRLQFGMMNHILCYSFQTLHEILKMKPGNLIICSPGTTFIQLPNEFDKELIIQRSNINADPIDLKKYLKGAIDLSAFRHAFANLWGVQCLWNVHKIVEASKFENIELKDIPEFNRIYNELNNLLGIQAMYIYSFSDDSIKESVIQTQMNNIENQIAISEEEKQLYENVINNLDKRFKEAINNNKNKITEIENIINILKRDIKSLEQNRYNIKHNKENNYIKKTNIGIIRTNLKDKKPKILYIDDKANEGWATIFKLMIYEEIDKDTTSHLFEIYAPESSEGDITIQYENNIKGIIETVKPDIILLDIRLFNESSSNHNFNKLSGIILLKKIRKYFIGTPIIMTTASNKAWSFEELMKLGADGYWIKEGIDEQRTAEETVRNYERFLELIDKTTSEKYKLLQVFYNEIDVIKKNPKWYLTKWGNINNIKGKVEATLLNSANLLRYYYSNKAIGYGNLSQVSDIYIYSAIIQNLGNIIEIIHTKLSTTNNYVTYVSGKIIGGEWSKAKGAWEFGDQDWFGYSLFCVRNEASHQSGIQTINHDKFKDFLLNLLVYLKCDFNQISINKNERELPSKEKIVRQNENYNEYYNTLLMHINKIN